MNFDQRFVIHDGFSISCSLRTSERPHLW